MIASTPCLVRRRPLVSGLLAARLLVAVGIAASGAACNCNAVKLLKTGPAISATPNPIALPNAATGVALDTTIKVSNKGHGNLIFSKAPVVVMKEALTTPVFAVRDLFVQNCDGSTRGVNTTELDSEGCATLTLRFLPLADGAYDGVLRFQTNDQVNPTYDVPITSSAATPKVHVCYENAGTETCNTDGQPLQVTVSDLVTLGSSKNLSFQLKSLGTRQASIDTMALAGDSDFTTTPAASAFHSTTLLGGATWPFTVVFAPVVGGLRTATVTFTTEDPANKTLTVQLTAQGDGPALCWCVGSANTRCVSTTTADFGAVPVMGTGNMFVELSSCGTKPLTFGTVALTTGGPEFTATNLPASGMVFNPTDPIITIPMTFSPPTNMAYTGRLEINTTNTNGFIDLKGLGAVSGCHLEAASNSINFGSVATGVEGKEMYAVSNTGTAECIFPQAAAITMGQPPFTVVSFPLNPVQPGGSVPFTVGYTPTGTSGVDHGQLAIYYEGAAAGSPLQTLDVALVGTEVATPVCVLQALPGAASIFGRTLNFGQVSINTTKVLPITFRNIGSSNCSINPGTIVPPTLPLPGFGDASAFKITTQPVSPIAPGATATLNVSFTPTAEEQYGSPLPSGGGGLNLGATVQVVTGDTVTFPGTDCSAGFGMTGAPGCVGWGLSGQGVTSSLVVLPADLNFGLVTLGCQSRTENVTLYNVGMVDIHVTGFTLDPAPPPTIFVLIAPPATTAAPITIHPGNSVTVQVRYRPSQLGSETGTLYINSDATTGMTGTGMNPYTTVSLEGSGTSNSMQTDTFIQPDHPIADVLWVIDQDSNSMLDKIAAISSNAQAFIQAAEQDHTDFHLGVVSVYVAGNLTTTTSTSDCGSNCAYAASFGGVTIKPGVLYHDPNGPAWVSSTDANPTTAFANEVRLGIADDVSGSETGLEGMYRALSTPNMAPGGANAGFLRDQARLIVIAISDDDDISTKPTAFYAAFLQSLKPNSPQDVTFSMVGGDLPNGCTNGVDGDPPDRYNDVVSRTGGKLYSICTGNYSQIAADLSLGSFGGLTRFVLSRACDPSTLVVTVNGAMVTNGTDYTYDAGQNAINFGTAPPPGATIVATYGTLCMP